MSWLSYIYPNPARGTIAAATGKTTKVVRCEACGQHYAYELKRTGEGQDEGGLFGGSYSVALERAEANLQESLAVGIEVIPCPACGWYQSSMIPKARRLHRRWMLYVGQCLTIGSIPVAIFGGLVNGIFEHNGRPSISWPIFCGALASLFVMGVGMLIWRYNLTQSFDPNDEDVETRKRYGQSRAVLLSEQEAKDVFAHAGALNQSRPTGWLFGCILAIICVVGMLSVVGFFAGRSIIRSHVPARFEKDLEAYVALAPAVPPEGLQRLFRAQVRGITGRIKGKMVVVNSSERNIDGLYFDLPDDLRATKPEEVATVVLLIWGKIKISGEGRMSSLFSDEYQQICLVKVFDWESKSEIATRTIFGGFPSSNLQSKEASVTGPKPNAAEILTFLTGLPRE